MIKIEIKPFLYVDPPPGAPAPRGPAAFRAALLRHLGREKKRILAAVARRRE